MLADGDVLVIAHKIVSKAEGRTVALGDVDGRRGATRSAAAHGKDPRLVEVILRETDAIVRSRPGVLICRTRHGFVCANAGVDASNAGAEGEVVLLPADPDASARALRARLRELSGAAPAIVIADSFGRAWRVGQCDVALGIAGLAPIDDWRGREDGAGPRRCEATVIAVADEAAAAADLARAQGLARAGRPRCAAWSATSPRATARGRPRSCARATRTSSSERARRRRRRGAAACARELLAAVAPWQRRECESPMTVHLPALRSSFMP